MQKKLIGLQPLATVLDLSIGWLDPVVIAAVPTDDSNSRLNPVALFDFRDVKSLGKDSVSQARKGTVVGEAKAVNSPFGCAVEFDGAGRISVSVDHTLDFNQSFSATVWINGSGIQLRTLEHGNRRGPNFQVAGDQLYFVTNSDSPVDNRSPSKKGQVHYSSAIWSGVADVNLKVWVDKQRTRSPSSGLEPKLQVVGDRLFFEYFGGDSDSNWQIYTGSGEADGRDWLLRQRTFSKRGYAAEQSRNIQVVGNKVYYAFPLKDGNGKWQLWTATSNLDGSSWKALQQTTDGGLIPSFRVSGDKIYYIYLSGGEKDRLAGDFKNDAIISSSNLDGSNWREMHRIPDAAWLIAQLAVEKGVIYYSFSRRDAKGNAHLWTGMVLKDGSLPRERQRTFGPGNATPAGIQVVGGKVMYAFSATKQPVASMMKSGRMGMSFWTANTDLNGDHWVQKREAASTEDDYLAGYKMLETIGGKSYYDLMRLHYVENKGGVVRHINGILAYSGSNIVNKGDAYGIGMTASGSVSGFVNAGEDYLYRGEAPKDIAGALVEQKLVPGWHHVAVTYDGTILRLYVDGKLARESRYHKKPAANPFPLSIGDGFVGKIARVMLFDHTLDQSEVSTLASRRRSSCAPVAKSL